MSPRLCPHRGNVIIHPDRGPVHVHQDQAGSAYLMRCETCGYAGAPSPSPASCPQCGSTEGWRDDHAVLPDYG